MRACLEAGTPCVVGTTGFDQERVDALAREHGLPVFFAPNFALGAVLMLRFAAEAVKLLPHAEIVELHHETKLDAPSGTAKATAALLPEGTPIHSIRLPGLVAHQEVIFGGPGQTLTIRHDTTSREAFVPGVLLALERLRSLPPGLTVGLDALLPCREGALRHDRGGHPLEQEQTGRTAQEWVRLRRDGRAQIRCSRTRCARWLKETYGVPRTAQWAIAMLLQEPPDGSGRASRSTRTPC